MSAQCCPPSPPSVDPAYRGVLWLAIVPDAPVFLVEVAGSTQSASASLLVAAIDFFGDAANYGPSLAVLSMALAWRARASLSKAASMAEFGLFRLGRVI